MQQQGSGEDQNVLTLQDRYRAVSALEQTLRLIYLDAVRTAGLAHEPHGGQDINEFETITDAMEELLFDCAWHARWVNTIIAEHPSIFEGWVNQVPEFNSLAVDVHDRLVKHPIADPNQLSEFLNQVPEEAKAAVQELEEQMATLRTGGQPDGDIKAKGLCALYGLAAVLVVAGGNIGLAAVVGFMIGQECL